MDRFATACAHCGSVFVPPIRAGPSGAFRMGAFTARCPHCKHDTVVRAQDATAALSTLAAWLL
jgi:uncharacterized OB-fold protein